MYKFFSSFPFSTHAAAFYFFALSNNHLDVWLSFISYLGRIWFRSPCVVHPYHLFFPFAAEGQDNSSGYTYVVVWVGGLEVWEISVFKVFYFKIKVYNFNEKK